MFWSYNLDDRRHALLWKNCMIFLMIWNKGFIKFLNPKCWYSMIERFFKRKLASSVKILKFMFNVDITKCFIDILFLTSIIFFIGEYYSTVNLKTATEIDTGRLIYIIRREARQLNHDRPCCTVHTLFFAGVSSSLEIRQHGMLISHISIPSITELARLIRF